MPRTFVELKSVQGQQCHNGHTSPVLSDTSVGSQMPSNWYVHIAGSAGGALEASSLL